MCGRFSLSAPSEEIGALFGLEALAARAPRYNIAPTQTVAAVRQEGGARRLVELRWGLVPGWAKDDAIGARLINARAETLSEKPSFRGAFKARRCLIPADGFYEWQKTGKGRAKQPFHLRRPDGKPFAFAGLWERWTRGAEPLESCAIITTEANGLLRPIHDRMPVILGPESFDTWLGEPAPDPAALAALLRPCPDDLLTAVPVSTAVNNPRFDGPV